MPTQTNTPTQTKPMPPRLGQEILRVDSVSRGFNKTQGELLVLEDVNENTIASLRTLCIASHALKRNLADHADGRDIRLREVAGHGLVHLARLDEVDVTDLCSLVAVLRQRLQLRDDTGTSLQNRDRVNIAALIEDLSHTNFLAENSNY